MAIKETLVIRIPEDRPRYHSIGLYLPRGPGKVKELRTKSHEYVNTIKAGMIGLFGYKV